jgi:hypothetical protein
LKCGHIVIIITKYLTQDIIYIINENNKTTLTELTPPHVRACPKLGAAFSISYVSFIDTLFDLTIFQGVIALLS